MGRQNVHRSPGTILAPTEMLQFSHLIAVYTIDRRMTPVLSFLLVKQRQFHPDVYTCYGKFCCKTVSGQLGQYIIHSLVDILVL